jgi:hypothetical protein
VVTWKAPWLELIGGASPRLEQPATGLLTVTVQAWS